MCFWRFVRGLSAEVEDVVVVVPWDEDEPNARGVVGKEGSGCTGGLPTANDAVPGVGGNALTGLKGRTSLSGLTTSGEGKGRAVRGVVRGAEGRGLGGSGGAWPWAEVE
jgi:hypothetical protein